MKLPEQRAFRFADPKTIRIGAFLLLIFGVVIFIRTRLLDMPLERDEGEFAYCGQMLLQGLSLYKHAPQCHGPGTCVAYALAMALFGQTGAAIHLGAMFVNLATVLLVFFLTRRMCGDSAGLVAAATYALLSMIPVSLGLAAHATHFVVLPALAGVFLLQSLDDETSLTRIFCAGLLLGVAALMKQTGAAFGLFAVVWVVRCELCSAAKSRLRAAKRLATLAAGGLLPLIVTCCIVVLSGDWDQFFFWTFKYLGLHAEVITTYGQDLEAGCIMAWNIFKGSPGLWSLALISPFLVWWGAGLQRWRFYILSFSFFSLLAAYPGWRGHYFIQLFPAAALLVGAGFRAAADLSQRLKAPLVGCTASVIIFLVAAGSVFIQWKEIYFVETPAQVSRSIYGANPFPEAVEVGDYLAAHCSKDGTIVVLGSEPEIYFYSHRRAATSLICTYYLMESHAYALPMQKQMIREIEQSNPEYVVFVNVSSSWLRRPNSNMLIIDWFKEYGRAHLRMVGLVEILREGSAYHWLNENDPPLRTSDNLWLAVYKRR